MVWEADVCADATELTTASDTVAKIPALIEERIELSHMIGYPVLDGGLSRLAKSDKIRCDAMRHRRHQDTQFLCDFGHIPIAELELKVPTAQTG